MYKFYNNEGYVVKYITIDSQKESLFTKTKCLIDCWWQLAMSWRQTCQIFWRMTFAVNLIQKYPSAVNFLVESLYRWQPLSRLLWASCLPWDCWSKLDSLPNLSEMRWSTSCRMEYNIYTWSYQGNHVIMCSSNVPFTRQDVLNAEFVFGPPVSYVRGSTTKESGMPQSGDRRCAVNAIQLHCTLVK